MMTFMTTWWWECVDAMLDATFDPQFILFDFNISAHLNCTMVLNKSINNTGNLFLLLLKNSPNYLKNKDK